MITTRGRYAVRALVDIARHQVAEGAVPLSHIAQRQQIAPSYLEQLLSKLRREGLLMAARGPGGGYRLMKLPEDICLADVFAAVEEQLDIQHDNQPDLPSEAHQCTVVIDGLWDDLMFHVKHYLQDVTIKDLCDNVDRVFPAPVEAEAEEDVPEVAHG